MLTKIKKMDIDDPKTKKSKRQKAIDQILVKDIKRLMHQNKVNRARLGPYYKNQGFLNCQQDVTPITNDEFRYEYEKYVALF
jgi:hypothetical protein